MTDAADQTGNTTDRNADTSDHNVETTDQGNISILQGLFNPFTGKDDTYWEAPYSLNKKGLFKGFYNLPLEQVAENIKGICQTGLSHMFLLIGYILSATYFGNDETKMSSRNPQKDVSIGDLVRLLGGFWKRQMVTDCLKAAFVDMQLRNNDIHLGNLAFDHLKLLARLKNQKERFKLAKKADANKWSPNDLRNEIDHLLGKDKTTLPEDKRIIKIVTRQLKDLDRMLSDSQIIGILEDKDRLGAALTNQEAGELLDNCKHFSKKLPDAQKTIQELAKTLVEVQMDKLNDY